MNTASSPLLKSPFRIVFTRYGWFIVNEHDVYLGQALMAYGEYGENEFYLLKQFIKLGQTVLDIGANMGTHTVFFAQLVGTKGVVHAFEPQRLIFQQLCANVILQSLLNVHCYPNGVGSEAGEMTVPPLNYEHTNNFGGLSLSAAGNGEKVKIITIDELNLSACDFIKADVEGMEKSVLEGAQKTINRFRPIMYVENDRLEKSAALITFIESLQYKMYWHAPRLFNANNFYNNPNNIYGNVASYNMICIPIERSMTLNAPTVLNAAEHPLLKK